MVVEGAATDLGLLQNRFRGCSVIPARGEQSPGNCNDLGSGGSGFVDFGGHICLTDRQSVCNDSSSNVPTVGLSFLAAGHRYVKKIKEIHDEQAHLCCCLN